MKKFEVFCPDRFFEIDADYFLFLPTGELEFRVTSGEIHPDSRAIAILASGCWEFVQEATGPVSELVQHPALDETLAVA